MSGKGAQAIVVYPRKEGSDFDMSYYLSTHMPLVAKHWKQYGLKSYAVTQLGDGPYSVSCTMEWESPEAIGKAMKSETVSEIMGDIPNFSKEQPVIVAGGIVGQETL